jgi:thymidylate kinase
VLVEFFGLPGSGKSTMSRCVAELLRTHGLNVDETTYELDHQHSVVVRLILKASHILRLAITHPFRLLSSLVDILSTDQSTWADFGKSLFNWLFIVSIVSGKRKYDRVVILDQGVAQAFWSINFAAQRQARLDKMLTSVQQSAIKPDLVIYVRAKLQTVGSRLSARTDRASRLNSFGYDVEALQHRHAQSEAIVRKLRSGGTCVIEVTSDERRQLAANATLIANSILVILSQDKQDQEIHSAIQHADLQRCQVRTARTNELVDMIPPCQQNVRRIP